MCQHASNHPIPFCHPLFGGDPTVWWRYIGDVLCNQLLFWANCHLGCFNTSRFSMEKIQRALNATLQFLQKSQKLDAKACSDIEASQVASLIRKIHDAKLELDDAAALTESIQSLVLEDGNKSSLIRSISSSLKRSCRVVHQGRQCCQVFSITSLPKTEKIWGMSSSTHSPEPSVL